MSQENSARQYSLMGVLAFGIVGGAIWNSSRTLPSVSKGTSAPVIALEIDSSGSYEDNLPREHSVPLLSADEMEGAFWRVSYFDRKITPGFEGVLEDSAGLSPLLSPKKDVLSPPKKLPITRGTNRKSPLDSGTFPQLAFQDADQFLGSFVGHPAIVEILWDGEISGKDADLVVAAKQLASRKDLILVAIVGVDPSLRSHVERLLRPIYGSRLVFASGQDRAEVIRRIRNLF